LLQLAGYALATLHAPFHRQPASAPASQSRNLLLTSSDIMVCTSPRRIHFLLVRNEEEVFGQLAVLLAALLDALASDSERVVLQALSVLGSIAGHAQHFRRVLMSLLDRWAPDEGEA
jgi:hypothetical protein